MPAAPLVAAMLVAAASITGAVALALAPDPWAPSAAALLVGGMSVVTLVTVAGVLLARGRWARHLASLIALSWIAIGAALASPIGFVVIAMAAAALTATAGPWLGRWVRRLPRADGAPAAAVAALIVLLITPAAMAVASPEGAPAASWVFSGWCVLLALAMARIVPGSLTAARLIHPVAAIAIVFTIELPAAVAALASAGVVATLCWRRDVTVAIAPILPVGGAVVRMPPELTPPDVLEAAGIDATGRPVPR